MKVLIIIPAYNEERNLPVLLDHLKQYSSLYDVLVVNDCSQDNTMSVCKNFGVSAVHLPVNLGIGGAVQTGYKYAARHGYDIAVQVDGDGQHNPDYIPQLVGEIQNGADLCIGSRFIQKQGFQSTSMRRAGIAYFTHLIRAVSGQAVTDPTSGFRACNRRVIEYFAKHYPKDYPEPETIVHINRKQYHITEIPVIMNEREQGQSSITSLKSAYYMIKVTLSILIAAISSTGGKN